MSALVPRTACRCPRSRDGEQFQARSDVYDLCGMFEILQLAGPGAWRQWGGAEALSMSPAV